MADLTEFMSKILTIMTPLGEVTSRRMFGGHGIFLGGNMFALVSKNDQLFLKADDVNKAAFIERGSKTHGKMPYYSAPAEALTGWADMKPWAEGAVEAALRSPKKGAPKKRAKNKKKQGV